MLTFPLIFICALQIDKSLADILSYSFEEYNALLPYVDARVYAFEDETINELGDILMNHGMNDTFGLCLLHNHFHVNLNEKLVEIVSNTSSHIDIVENVSLSSSDINIKPYMFELTDNLDLKPMEFVDLTYSNFGSFTNEVQERFSYFDHELINNDNDKNFDNFLHDFYNKLYDTDRINIFGLCIKHRESINSADENMSTLETNHPKQRWLK